MFDLFEDGASVVLQGLHRYWTPISELVRDLELTLGHPCQANAYLTPPGAQGFAVHSDSHDVFVFQTHGTKLWEVHDEAGTREVMLEPGISMYLPTGTPHAARSQVSASLHVTVGINQITWRQLLQQATNQVLEDEIYDAPVPAGYLDDQIGFAERLAEQMDELTTGLTALDADALATEQTSSFLSSRTGLLRGGLSDRLALSKITDDTMLSRRPGTACTILEQDGLLVVLLGDRELRMPQRLMPAMCFVRDRSSFRPGDLHEWLDPQSSLVLSRRLVREGLLRVDG